MYIYIFLKKSSCSTEVIKFYHCRNINKRMTGPMPTPHLPDPASYKSHSVPKPSHILQPQWNSETQPVNSQRGTRGE